MYGSLEHDDLFVPVGDDDLSKASPESRSSSTTSCSTVVSEESMFLTLPSTHDRQPPNQTHVSTFLFELLGFPSNPLVTSIDQSSPGPTRNNAAAVLRLAMLSQFSTAYNILNVSFALQLLDSSKVSKSLCSSALIAGMIVGQCIGGTLGDMVGRHVAMAICMGLQVIGALGSATSFHTKMLIEIDLYTILAGWRFLLGVGCGGVYPLAATMTAESTSSLSSSTTTTTSSPKLVALTFSMQGVGYLVVPCVAWVLVQFFPSNVAWRFLLGLGSVPGIVVTVWRLRQQQHYRTKGEPFSPLSTTHVQDIGICASTRRKAPVSVWDAIRMEENLVIKLLGTAGCWFLFDIMFYANTLFQPMVLSSAFGSTETVSSTARDSILIALIALPGYIVSIASVGGCRQPPRYIQLQGFFFMAVLYTIMGLIFHMAPRWLLLALYGATFFCSNYGPNCTTFLLPSMTFSKPCRSTLNGFCAACGKAGALMGTILFGTVKNGQVVVLWCASLSIVGWFMTYTCVVAEEDVADEDQQKMNREDDEERVPMKVVMSRASIFDWHE